jgi:GH15 family glucan-1,4-alpha-glucosidase
MALDQPRLCRSAKAPCAMCGVALEKMFTYANHLGLYAEQIGRTGEQLGNFPQAFTHLALISAVCNPRSGTRMRGSI